MSACYLGDWLLVSWLCVSTSEGRKRRIPTPTEANRRLHGREGSSLMSSGTGDKIKGRVKEAAGALAGDEKLKNEGKTDQLVGRVKNSVERVVDKAKELVKDS